MSRKIKNFIENCFIKKAVLLVTILLLSLYLIPLTSCCVDLSKYLKPLEKEKEYSINDSSEDFSKEELEKLLEEFTNPQQNQQDTPDYSTVKKELSNSLNYEVSEVEEEEFFKRLKEIYESRYYENAASFINELKLLYPKGYFTIIKVSSEDSFDWFTTIYNNTEDDLKDILGSDFNSNYATDISTIIHEDIHGGSGFTPKNLFKIEKSGYIYLIDYLGVFIDKERMLFPKTEIYQDIENPDRFDTTYLDPNEKFNSNGTEIGHGNIDIVIILDELNAYTISVETAIALEKFYKTNSFHDVRYGLLKQMSHLQLYLIRCKKKHPDDWEYIIGHKGFAFLILKLWQRAERFEKIVKNDFRFNLNADAVEEAVYSSKNYSIIEEFYNNSNIKEYEDLSFEEEDFSDMEIFKVKS